MMNEIIKAMVLLVLSVIFIQCSGTKNASNILTSNNIGDIQNYLNNAHPDDPKNALLKKRIIHLKNEAWMKKQVKPIPVEYAITTADKNFISDADPEKFEELLQADRLKHKDRTVNFLNEMFDSNRNSPNTILLVKNRSHCNTILHIKEGTVEHDLAVPHDGENFIVLEKGKYSISGSICGAKYEKVKDLRKGIYLTLNR